MKTLEKRIDNISSIDALNKIRRIIDNSKYINIRTKKNYHQYIDRRIDEITYINSARK